MKSPAPGYFFVGFIVLVAWYAFVKFSHLSVSSLTWNAQGAFEKVTDTESKSQTPPKKVIK